MVIAKKGEAADDRTVVRESFRFAVEHGAGKHSKELWHTGISGYDTWIAALEDEKKCTGDELIGFGCAYNAQCWSECRRNAVTFLEEARKRLSKDEEVAALLDDAIRDYTVVRDNLNAVGKTFPFDVSDQAGMKARIREADRRAKAVAALKTARDAETAGLNALANIADALGG